MALPIYLKIIDETGKHLEGSVKAKGLEGCIELISFEHRVSRPTDGNTGKLTGERVHDPIKFVKELDRSSVYLDRAAGSGRSWQQATFDFQQVRPDGEIEVYFSMVLKDVKVVSVTKQMLDIKDPENKAYKHLEEVELRYEEITWDYKDGNHVHTDNWETRPIVAAAG
ncbi:MAG: type VI secretion system tube protein Hcp [Paucimonas sp.]|jgi:type VI secretion system secreted protein Hcp|nr:type VI secretion system tube protein Hcp [Paucimonas sp.]